MCGFAFFACFSSALQAAGISVDARNEESNNRPQYWAQLIVSVCLCICKYTIVRTLRVSLMRELSHASLQHRHHTSYLSTLFVIDIVVCIVAGVINILPQELLDASYNCCSKSSKPDASRLFRLAMSRQRAQNNIFQLP